MTWLLGGPYYELSFLVLNSKDKGQLIHDLLGNVEAIPQIEMISSKEQVQFKTQAFIEGAVDGDLIHRSLDVNIKVDVAGNRKSRLYIQELSDNFVKVNFWFYGSVDDADEFNQKGLKPKDKPKFKLLFKVLKAQLNPVLGTTAYEEDCSGLFSTQPPSPHADYSFHQLILKDITEKVNGYSFEYCWINIGQVGNEEEIEIINVGEILC